MDTWNKVNKNAYKTLDRITAGDICDELYNIGVSHIYHFLRLFEMARRKYLLWQKGNLSYPFERFIQYCSRDRYYHAEVLGIEYYAGNGGYLDNSHFLFGRASQFRHSKL